MLWPGRLYRAASHASAIAMPTPLPKPCPSGPVETSTPDRVPALGMARGFAAPLAEALQFFKRKIVAGEMKQAVEQHRPVSGGKHEAVAVEPVRILGIVLQKLDP